MRTGASGACFQTRKHAVAVIRESDYPHPSCRRFDHCRIGKRYPNGDMLVRLARGNRHRTGYKEPQKWTGIA